MSTETLIRLTPKRARSAANASSCVPLVVSVSSSSAPLARCRESRSTSVSTPLRTSGSPPVSLSLRVPVATNAEAMRSISSSVSTSAFGRKVMCSAMQ